MAFKTLREFIQLESSGGIILFGMAMVAIIVANSPLAHYYTSLFDMPLAVQFGTLKLSKPLLLWINDGFMAIFFMLVGLEIKREMIEGELNTMAKASLPAIAAVGGMVVPAFIYVYLNWGDPAAIKGWAIPTATDIAFSLGILAILGSRIPVSLKIFLTALAIFDDIGAILIIAIFYTKHVSLILLIVAGILVVVLWLLNRFRVTHFAAYFIVGTILWVCVLKSGVHATLAGIVIAFAIPLRHPRDLAKSPLRDLEHMLHPWVAYGILPLFAFANAGVSFKGLTLGEFFSPVPLGIALGLLVGKQVGIFGASMIGIKLKLARMPHGTSAMGIYGIGLIAGVGFTMSLFIGTLAFSPTGHYPALVRLGVIAGSLLSGLFGFLLLRFAYRKHNSQVSDSVVEA